MSGLAERFRRTFRKGKLIPPSPTLYALLDYLGQGNHPSNGHWQNWQITQISGGLNNLLYRATGSVGDFAIKFTIKPATAKRIRIYYKIMLVWWAVRLARYLYEVPQGLDKRLVNQPIDWQAKKYAQYEHYLRLAETML